MIRLFDILIATTGLTILAPLLFIIALLIAIDSKGGPLYLQKRIGRHAKSFYIYKFRTMYIKSDNKKLLTIGENDKRITKIGKYLRKYKLDEIPQLLNVLKGDMSLVGPRPEVEKYIAYYAPDERKVLRVKPGITDLASIYFFNENELLAQSKDPENFYIHEILPLKLELNQIFIEKPKLNTYFSIIRKTIQMTFHPNIKKNAIPITKKEFINDKGVF
jgi:lipopolysaccharide/colanic/teichoic acid biosynthesis glycosyltransferase